MLAKYLSVNIAISAFDLGPKDAPVSVLQLGLFRSVEMTEFFALLCTSRPATHNITGEISSSQTCLWHILVAAEIEGYP
jgi:hypothetical protein